MIKLNVWSPVVRKLWTIFFKFLDVMYFFQTLILNETCIKFVWIKALANLRFWMSRLYTLLIYLLIIILNKNVISSTNEFHK